MRKAPPVGLGRGRGLAGDQRGNRVGRAGGRFGRSSHCRSDNSRRGRFYRRLNRDNGSGQWRQGCRRCRVGDRRAAPDRRSLSLSLGRGVCRRRSDLLRRHRWSGRGGGLRRGGGPLNRGLGRRQQLFHHRLLAVLAQTIIDGRILEGNFLAARIVRLDLGRAGLGLDERRPAMAGLSSILIGIPDHPCERGGGGGHGDGRPDRTALGGDGLDIPLAGGSRRIGPQLCAMLPVHERSSSSGSTPITLRPAAMTVATAWTRASRAIVSERSLSSKKRSCALSLPLVYSCWKIAAKS